VLGFGVMGIWQLNTKATDEKTSPSEVFTTIRTREDEYAYLEKDDEQA